MENGNKMNKQNSYLFTFGIGIVIGLSLLTISYAQEPDYQIPEWSYFPVGQTWTIEEREIMTWKTEVMRTTNPIVNKQQIVMNSEWDWKNQEVATWWTESVLEAIKSLWVKDSYAITIVNSCKETWKDRVRCSEFAVWIPAIESALFTRCGYDWHNCYWLWWESRLMKFPSVEDGIKYRIKQWSEHWYNNAKASDYITKSGYCVWGCSNLINWQSNIWWRPIRYLYR